METPNRFLESVNGLLERVNRSPYTYALIAALIGVNVGRVLNISNLETQQAALESGAGAQTECGPCSEEQKVSIQTQKRNAEDLVKRMLARCESDPRAGICEKIDETKRALDVALHHTEYRCATVDVWAQTAGNDGMRRSLAITESTYKPGQNQSATVCIYPEAFLGSSLDLTLIHEAVHSLEGRGHAENIKVIEGKLTIADLLLAGPDASSK